jgi:protocatechuate 3,4-dioxygenase beta subunit
MKMQKNKAGLLGRRELILRTAGVLTFTGMGRGVITKALAQTSTSVVLTPEETEGPYWVDEQLNHSDLATDPTDNSIQVGLPLVLAVTVSQYANGSITPLKGACVDLWHCNAYGIYSDEAAYNPGGGTGTVVTTGKKFLRGYQVTDAHGSARFTSIYPGWYTSRTPHIHARVRLYSGSTVTENFTTQFFFDESITDMVYQMAPYNTRPNRDTTNITDNVYKGTDCNTAKAVGTETSLRLAADSSHAVASYNIILDLTNGYSCGTAGNPTGGPPGGTPPSGGPPGGGTPPGGGPPPGTPPAPPTGGF